MGTGQKQVYVPGEFLPPRKAMPFVLSPIRYLSPLICSLGENSRGSSQVHEHIATLHSLDDPRLLFLLGVFGIRQRGIDSLFRLSYSLDWRPVWLFGRLSFQNRLLFPAESHLVAGLGVLFYLSGLLLALCGAFGVKSLPDVASEALEPRLAFLFRFIFFCFEHWFINHIFYLGKNDISPVSGLNLAWTIWLFCRNLFCRLAERVSSIVFIILSSETPFSVSNCCKASCGGF